jgi:predicted phosphodiesterase
MFAHVLSDIHLEMDKCPATHDISNYFSPVNKADYLFLLGDIGVPHEDSYSKFLQSCTRKYQKVFMVAGNHEMYHTTGEDTVEDTVSKLREICTENEKLVFLDKETYDLPGLNIRIAGTTLWSRVTEAQMSDIRCFISDYRAIKGWTVEHNNYVHANCVQWLKMETEKAKQDGKKLVIMTHHAPLLNSCHPKHMGSPLSSAYETDLSELIKVNPHISLWLHGHTHHSEARTVGSTTVLSNQCGYSADKDAKASFNPDLRIDLRPS